MKTRKISTNYPKLSIYVPTFNRAEKLKILLDFVYKVFKINVERILKLLFLIIVLRTQLLKY